MDNCEPCSVSVEVANKPSCNPPWLHVLSLRAPLPLAFDARGTPRLSASQLVAHRVDRASLLVAHQDEAPPPYYDGAAHGSL